MFAVRMCVYARMFERAWRYHVYTHVFVNRFSLIVIATAVHWHLDCALWFVFHWPISQPLYLLRHEISHHITSHHITSHYITSHHITSHHIISHHITSHHITSHMTAIGSMLDGVGSPTEHFWAVFDKSLAHVSASCQVRALLAACADDSSHTARCVWMASHVGCSCG